MRVEVELKNYRCFPMGRPARLELGGGMAGVVGINNAGKSALLKFFFEARDLFSQLATPNPTGQAINGAAQGVNFVGVADQEEVFSNLNQLGMEITFRLVEDPEASTRSHPLPTELVITIRRDNRTWTLKIDGEHGHPPAEWAWDGTTITMVDEGRTPLYDLKPWFEFFDSVRTSLYIGSFRNAIQVGNGQHYDLPIGQSFVAQWDQYRSGPIKRNNDAAQRLIEEIRSIFGFERLDVTATAANDTLQVIIDGKSQRLDEVGAGIAHFVMVLATVAVASPGYIFIDEPELNLHPALQLSFLSTLGSYAQRGVVFATHSLGLARASGTPLYSVRRIQSNESDVRRLEDTPTPAEFLGELGFSGYQELGYDQVLLVEGPSDVLMMQQLLRLYRADHKVVLLHLGGSATINGDAAPLLQEITRLSGRVSAVVDSERSSKEADPEGRVLAFAGICKELGVDCHVLARLAAENYLTHRAVTIVKGEKYRALQPYEHRTEADPTWAKNENWRIASEMTLDEIAATDLGEFLALLVETPAGPAAPA